MPEQPSHEDPAQRPRAPAPRIEHSWETPDRSLAAWGVNLAARGALGLAAALPYERRVRFMGRLAARVVGPVAGYDKRVRDNLRLVCPELGPGEVARITDEALDTAGRMLAEMYSARELTARVARSPLSGPGLATLEAARDARRPVILVSGHFGSYDAVRIALAQGGYNAAGLYRPMRNAWFNAHYERAMHAVSEPVFVQSRRGIASLVRHLRSGHMIALLTDQRDEQGARLSFFGKPVMTPLSAAEMALKYDALLMPAYGTRLPGGLDFKVEVEAPIPPSDPETMMQAVNDSLEARVRANMGQWLWSHRRWKMPDAPA